MIDDRCVCPFQMGDRCVDFSKDYMYLECIFGGVKQFLRWWFLEIFDFHPEIWRR